MQQSEVNGTDLRRKIIFRGKAKDSGKWLYGDLNHVYDGVYVFGRQEDDLDSPDAYEVDPKTVGQLTEVKDDEGKDVWEGDLIRNATDWEVVYCRGCFSAKIIGREVAPDTMHIALRAVRGFKVIGTIHD